MGLNSKNYYDHESNLKYMSVSQFKDFLSCESQAMAKLADEYSDDSKSFQLGHYLHAWNKGALGQFIEDNKAIIFQKNGKKYADYQKADDAIRCLENDPLALKALEGEKEVIMTGQIFGADWKIRIDNLHEKRFSDLKYIKDFKSIYDPITRTRRNFIEHYGYHFQMAVYQEIIRQSTGRALEPLIVAVTKEDTPDKAIFGGFERYEMEFALEIISHKIKRILDVKNRRENPASCGRCDWCKAKKKLAEVTKWNVIDL